MLEELVPAIDGGVYAHDGEGGIWYLRGSEAVRVREVAAFSPASSARPGRDRQALLVALLSRERQRRRKAELEKTDLELEVAAQADAQEDQEAGDRRPW